MGAFLKILNFFPHGMFDLKSGEKGKLGFSVEDTFFLITESLQDMLCVWCKLW